MLQIDRRILTHFDYILPLLLLPLIGVSYFLVHELHPVLAQKQVIYFTIGVLIFLLFFLLPLRRLAWMIPILYWLNILLLVSVNFFGVTKLGATRWLEVPIAGFTMQPSEIMKPAMVLMLAYLIQKQPPHDERGYGWKPFAKLSFYIFLPFVLIMKEPDLGSALVLLIVGYGVLFLVGVRMRIWLGIVTAVVLVAPLIYANLHDYQKKRIKDFLAEKPSYHVHQSIIAIGSGGVTGQPKEEATQTHLRFLPIAVSDFIFSFFMERFGFAGAVLLIALYGLIILHLIMMFLYLKGDYFAQVVASALAFLFFLYSGVNIAMTIGLAPVVGLPLPLFSYGGSSFLTFMMLLGIFENLVSFRHDRLYDSIRYSGF